MTSERKLTIGVALPRRQLLLAGAFAVTAAFPVVPLSLVGAVAIIAVAHERVVVSLPQVESDSQLSRRRSPKGCGGNVVLKGPVMPGLFCALTPVRG